MLKKKHDKETAELIQKLKDEPHISKSASSPWRNQVLPNDGACNEDSDDSAAG